MYLTTMIYGIFIYNAIICSKTGSFYGSSEAQNYHFRIVWRPSASDSNDRYGVCAHLHGRVLCVPAETAWHFLEKLSSRQNVVSLLQNRRSKTANGREVNGHEQVL